MRRSRAWGVRLFRSCRSQLSFVGRNAGHNGHSACAHLLEISQESFEGRVPLLRDTRPCACSGPLSPVRKLRHPLECGNTVDGSTLCRSGGYEFQPRSQGSGCEGFLMLQQIRLLRSIGQFAHVAAHGIALGRFVLVYGENGVGKRH